ncbi:glycosyltransferase family 4 protein [Rubinisphaera sp. JC750]|uniref:glycosyltransferase family 4 protein n=1 Tax=Rubinisphaera sp. JC750 TaxID=2898658 RepID=UPI001F25E997|nr:glycosyltransferase family 4 protein [Rubinisphaera sp. JC750]
MRIALVTPEFPTEDSYSGGLANYLGRIAPALSEQGHDVHIFTKSHVANEILDYRGVQVHRVIPLWDHKMRLDRLDRFVPRSHYAPYQDLKAAWSLHRRWKREHQGQPFDLVQLTNVLAVGWFFRKETSVPVVMRLSSFRPAWDTAAGVTITSSVKARWWMEKKVIQATRHLYAPTRFVARLTEDNYGTGHVRVIETPFYQEEPELDPTLYEQYCRGRRYILFFGRKTQMKGVHLLAAALPAVMKQHPQMHAVFVGSSATAPDGSTMDDYIRNVTREVADRVTILESVRHDKLYPLIQNAELIALPSLMDNLPNTCLEAMAHGRVVVATTGSCFEQLIEDGKSGVLVAPNDVEALTRGLSNAWSLSDDAKHDIGEHARRRIADLHPERVIQELLAFYDAVYPSSRPAPVSSSPATIT